MSSPFRRMIRLQREILKTIRADVRKSIGPQNRELRRYYEAYKREFRGSFSYSSKEELLKRCHESDIIFVGDYHTFSPSQKAALRLLRELGNQQVRMALGIEMVKVKHQSVLDAFAAKEIDEETFLERMNYKANWGFPWEHFRPLILFARDRGYPMIALNDDSPQLAQRDERAAELIVNFLKNNPHQKVFALYGDLHLARGHIPRSLNRRLRAAGLRKRALTIFQNSESLYWKLTQDPAARTVDVLQLGRWRFCIMNATPWVKLQSYLEWSESSALLDMKDEEGPGINLQEATYDRLKNLAAALSLDFPKELDFTIQTVNDLAFLRDSPALRDLGRRELKAVKHHILGNRGIFLPNANLIYLASTSVNALCEGASALLHSVLSRAKIVCHDPKHHFFAATLNMMVAYFGSKILNPNRKCDMEGDLTELLKRPLPRKALSREKLQKRAAKAVLKHCKAQRSYLNSKRYLSPRQERGPESLSLFFETSRHLGSIMGEKLYASYIDGRYPQAKIQELFATDLNDERGARRLYLSLVEELAKAPEMHKSKLDLF